MALLFDLSFYFKLPSIFTVMIPLPVYYCYFCLGMILEPYSRWFIPSRYHWPIISFATSIFMDFSANIHTISAIRRIHHFIAIPIYGSLYLQLRLAIVALLAPDSSSFMLFAPPTLILLAPIWYHLQPPLPLHLLFALCFGGALVKTVEHVLIPDIYMKYFIL